MARIESTIYSILLNSMASVAPTKLYTSILDGLNCAHYTLYIHPRWLGLRTLYSIHLPSMSRIAPTYSIHLPSMARIAPTILYKSTLDGQNCAYYTLYIYPRWPGLHPLYSIHLPSMSRIAPTILYTSTLDGQDCTHYTIYICDE